MSIEANIHISLATHEGSLETPGGGLSEDSKVNHKILNLIQKFKGGMEWGVQIIDLCFDFLLFQRIIIQFRVLSQWFLPVKCINFSKSLIWCKQFITPIQIATTVTRGISCKSVPQAHVAQHCEIQYSRNSEPGIPHLNVNVKFACLKLVSQTPNVNADFPKITVDASLIISFYSINATFICSI